MADASEFRNLATTRDRCLLCVATQGDLAAHEGVGLVDWRKVAARQKFIVDLDATTDEMGDLIIPMLGLPSMEDPEVYFLRRLMPTINQPVNVFEPVAVTLTPRGGTWSNARNCLLFQDRFRVCLVLLDRIDDERGVVLKQFDDGKLRFLKRVSSAQSSRMKDLHEEVGYPALFVPSSLADSIELLDPPTFGETLIVSGDRNEGHVGSVCEGFQLYFNNLDAAMCLQMIARRPCCDRGAFRDFPREILNLVAIQVAERPRFSSLNDCGMFSLSVTFVLILCRDLMFPITLVLAVLRFEENDYEPWQLSSLLKYIVGELKKSLTATGRSWDLNLEMIEMQRYRLARSLELLPLARADKAMEEQEMLQAAIFDSRQSIWRQIVKFRKRYGFGPDDSWQ